MKEILNSTGINIPQSSIEAIQRAASKHHHTEEVKVVKSSTDGGRDQSFDCYGEEDGDYLFSIDIDGDVIYHK